MYWTEFELITRAENEDYIVSGLYDLKINSLSIEDPKEADRLDQNKESWDYIEEDIFTIEKGLIKIKVYFSDEDKPREKIEKIRKFLFESKDLNIKEEDITIRQVREEDWSENWKAYYKPLEIGEKIVIKPSWESYEPRPGQVIIELDPGMAFGTGTHETTFMCGEALQNYVKPGHRVYDIGTGSGILSIIASKLGASPVLGVDLDPLAIKTSLENARINGLDLGRDIDFKEGDLLNKLSHKADLVVANIIAEVIASIAEDVYKILKPGGVFISSGIILEKLDLVEESLTREGFEILEVLKKNSWACIVARR